MPIRCHVRCTSSHSSAVSFPKQICSRTAGSKISAPPPVIAESPASRRISSVSPNRLLENDASRDASLLHRREGLHKEISIERTQAADQIQVPLGFERGMQPSHHVDLRHAVFESRPHFFHDLIHGELEGVRLPLPGAKRAELARQNAVIGIIDVLIVDIRGDISILPFADHIRDGPQAVQILRGIEHRRLRVPHPAPLHDLVENRAQLGRKELGDHVWLDDWSPSTKRRSRPLARTAFLPENYRHSTIPVTRGIPFLFLAKLIAIPWVDLASCPYFDPAQ